MKEDQEFVPVTKAKAKLLELIRRIENQDDTVAITKKGVPSVVMMSRTKFEGLLETIDILSDEATMTSYKKGINEFKKGKWAKCEEVFSE